MFGSFRRPFESVIRLLARSVQILLIYFYMCVHNRSSQNEPHHPHECVCGASVYSKSISFSKCRWTVWCSSVQGLDYIYSGVYWASTSASFHLLWHFPVSKALLGFVYVCGFPSAHLNMGHNAQLRFLQPGTPYISWIALRFLSRYRRYLLELCCFETELCWLASSWSLARHAQNDLLPAVCAAVCTPPQNKDSEINVRARRIFSIKISLDLSKSIESRRISPRRRGACIYFSATLSFNILKIPLELPLKKMDSSQWCSVTSCAQSTKPRSMLSPVSCLSLLT